MHTHQVIEDIMELLSLVKDAETGQRGFLLTNNIDYLAPYEFAVHKINAKLYKIKALTRGDSIQQVNLDKLSVELNNKIVELNNTVSLNQKRGLASALEVVKTNEGKASMDSIRAIVNRILDTEDAALILRERKMEHSFWLYGLVSYFSLFFIAAMSMAAMAILHWRQRENINLIEKLNVQNQSLELQVKERTKELEESNAKLLMLNEDKNKFLGMAAHDLKSPINTIKGLVSILHAMGGGSNEQKEILDHITKSTTKMSKLISDLLDINKIDQGQTQLLLETTDLFELTESVVFSFKEAAKKKDISIHLYNLLNQKEITTDKSMLARILENLISNALKFSQKGKDIFISLKNEEGQFVILVRDQGLGIPEQELPLLFGKFQKLSNRPTEGESSTGLGMSIVKSLVDSLHGTIECISQVNVGTVFTLRFQTSSFK